MTFRTKDSVNSARNLPQSKQISATLGREVAPFIMSGIMSVFVRVSQILVAAKVSPPFIHTAT